jgi:hypothetical protein
MHNELRYQAKVHVISDMPRKGKNKIPASFPPIYLFLNKIKNML